MRNPATTDSFYQPNALALSAAYGAVRGRAARFSDLRVLWKSNGANHVDARAVSRFCAIGYRKREKNGLCVTKDANLTVFRRQALLFEGRNHSYGATRTDKRTVQSI